MKWFSCKTVGCTLLLTTAIIIASCLEEADPAFDGRAFTKVYDHSRFDASFHPIDVQETADGGYLILGGYDLPNTTFTGIYLLKTDAAGNFVDDVEGGETLVNPVAELMNIGGSFYFLCMDPFTQQSHVAQVDWDNLSFSATAVATNLPYPAAATADNGAIITLAYDHVNKESVMAILSTAGAVSLTRGFSIGPGDDVEEPMINHFLRTGRQFPFQTGKAGSLYYFNGFYNYTFSLVFTDLADTSPNGVVQGQQDEGGISAVQPLTGSQFALSRFNFGDNYLLPGVTLNTGGLSAAIDLGGYDLPELDPNATVRILRATINTRNVLAFACNTRSNQVGIYFYDEATREFISSSYIGYSNPLEVAAIRQTAGGDLILAGTTVMAGRFPRCGLVKINKDDISLP